MAVKPLSPKEIESAKKVVIPDAVMEAANELLAKKWNGSSATFTIDALCGLAREKMGDPKHQFASEDLDIEIVFRKEGWIVDFDRPGYNETYAANWTFKKRRTRG